MRDHHAGLRRGISIHALRVEGDMNELLYSLIEHISIHALRVEGDLPLLTPTNIVEPFLSTPSGWRATSQRIQQRYGFINFYPRPPGGGRPYRSILSGSKVSVFLSTPSGWRATKAHGIAVAKSVISIHALRVEGDALGHGRALCAF